MKIDRSPAGNSSSSGNRPWEGRSPSTSPQRQAELLRALERTMSGPMDEKSVRIRKLAEEIDAMSGIIDSMPQA